MKRLCRRTETRRRRRPILTCAVCGRQWTRDARRAPDAKQAEAYRLSLEGWRRFEKQDAAAAQAALERSLALNASDPVSRYRLGRVLQAQASRTRALAAFEAAIRGARTCPASILGAAYLEAARLARTGRPPRAAPSPSTASPPRSSVPPPTRERRRRARSRVSAKPPHTRRVADTSRTRIYSFSVIQPTKPAWVFLTFQLLCA